MVRQHLGAGSGIHGSKGTALTSTMSVALSAVEQDANRQRTDLYGPTHEFLERSSAVPPTERSATLGHTAREPR
jgi:hypothetical protein